MTDILPLYMKLFERCEEMRPTLHGMTLRLAPLHNTVHWHSEYAGKWSFACDLRELEALALCRCAVEDWLRKRHEIRLSDNTEVSIEVDDYRPREGRVWVWKSYNGPTIHHALIAAANVVRNEQENPQ
jgi:hypothetical protein